MPIAKQPNEYLEPHHFVLITCGLIVIWGIFVTQYIRAKYRRRREASIELYERIGFHMSTDDEPPRYSDSVSERTEADSEEYRANGDAR